MDLVVGPRGTFRYSSSVALLARRASVPPSSMASTYGPSTIERT